MNFLYHYLGKAEVFIKCHVGVFFTISHIETLPLYDYFKIRYTIRSEYELTVVDKVDILSNISLINTSKQK